MGVTEIPTYFRSIQKHLQSYHDFLRQKGLTPVRAALGFMMGLGVVDIGLCGVNNAQQLEEICTNAQPLTGIDFEQFAVFDEAILNPVRWKV